MYTSTLVVSTPGNRCKHSSNSLQAYMSSIFVILKFKHAHLKFTVYGRKQVNKHIHTCAQCSNTSVGLAQARPN